MVIDRLIGFWTILSVMYWINSCTCHRIYYQSPTSFGPDYINSLTVQMTVLQQLVINQASKIEMLKKELNSVKETLSKNEQANNTKLFENEFNLIKEALSKLDKANKTEMFEKELNSVKETLSKLNQANETAKLKMEVNSLKIEISKLDQANGTEMLKIEVNSLREELSKLDQDNKTAMLEMEVNSLKKELSKLDQANETAKLKMEVNSLKEELSNLDQSNKTAILKMEVNSLKEELSKLDQSNKTAVLEMEVNSLKEELSKLDHFNETAMLEMEVKSLKKELSKLDQSNKTKMLEMEVNSLKEELSKLHQSNKTNKPEMEVNSLKKELPDHTNNTEIEKEELMPDQVAFHVVASSNSSPGVVIFDHVISNIGSRYDNSSGIFTVPTTGFYVFSWSIETYGQLTEAALLANGIEMGISKSDEAPSYYDTTTSFAVLNLTRKDKVWVSVKTGQAEAMHTIFSGWMINKSDSTAFYASLSRDLTGSPIIFNNEILDTDDAYSTTTGKFVAPRSGLYVFMMSGLTHGDNEFYCKFIFSNGISQPRIWIDSSGGRNDSSGYMTFAWMNTGESVYINTKSLSGTATRMMATSMFAGWLLIDDTNVSKSTFPAFLAGLSGGMSFSTPVVYDVSYGGNHHGYSTSTGFFTADRDGLYLFMYNTEAYEEVVHTALRVNGLEIFETRSDGRHSEFDDTSAVTVLRLSSNDRVSVGVKSGKVLNDVSLFFGILLFEI